MSNRHLLVQSQRAQTTVQIKPFLSLLWSIIFRLDYNSFTLGLSSTYKEFQAIQTLLRKLLLFKGSLGFSSSSSWPLTALEVISKLNCSLSMCHWLFKTIVTLDTKGMKSGYICQAVLRRFFGTGCLDGVLFGVGLLWRDSVWSCERVAAQVTPATAFDSPSLFANQKRVSVWVSLKACPEIGSFSLYACRTGTV